VTNLHSHYLLFFSIHCSTYLYPALHRRSIQIKWSTRVQAPYVSSCLYVPFAIWKILYSFSFSNKSNLKVERAFWKIRIFCTIKIVKMHSFDVVILWINGTVQLILSWDSCCYSWGYDFYVIVVRMESCSIPPRFLIRMISA